MRGRHIVIILILISAFSCKRPVPYTEEDIPTAIKVDTIFVSGGVRLHGDELYQVLPQKRSGFLKWPYWVAIVTCVLFCGSVLLHRRRVYLEKEVRASQAVLTILKDKMDIVRNLTDKRVIAEKRTIRGSYFDRMEALQQMVDNYQHYLEELRGDKTFFGNMEESLNIAKNNIMQNARRLLGQSIQETDYAILCCFIAGMTTSAVSFVVDLRPGTVRTRKSRLKSKIMELPHSSEKTDLLMALNNDM